MFAWYRTTPPFFIGGAEVSHNILAERLVGSGYEVRYLGSYTNLVHGSLERFEEFRSYFDEHSIPFRGDIPGDPLIYSYKGVQCKMTRRERLMEDIDNELKSGVDLLITAQEDSDVIAARATAHSVKTVAWMHSVSPTGLLTLKAEPNYVLCTSEFVRQHIKDGYDVDGTLFYPPFEDTPLVLGTGSAITLINPVPEKGVNIFLELAERVRGYQFIAVEGWYPIEDKSQFLRSNVQYISRQMDLRPIFQRTRILMVPSRVDEGFGRVVVEAALHGIPSIVSARGGLLEAVGDGGILVHNSIIEEWITAVNALENPGLYKTLSERARLHSRKFLRDPVEELRKKAILPEP